MTSQAVEGTWICTSGLHKMVGTTPALCFIMGSKRLETDANSQPMSSSVSRRLEPVMKHSPLFLTSSTIPVIIVSCFFFTHLSLSQEYMPLPPGEEEEKSSDQNLEPKLQFSYVECLIFAFHQLAKKVR